MEEDAALCCLPGTHRDAAVKAVQAVAPSCEEVPPCSREPVNFSLMLVSIWGAVGFLCSRFSEWSGKMLLGRKMIT